MNTKNYIELQIKNFEIIKLQYPTDNYFKYSVKIKIIDLPVEYKLFKDVNSPVELWYSYDNMTELLLHSKHYFYNITNNDGMFIFLTNHPNNLRVVIRI